MESPKKMEEPASTTTQQLQALQLQASAAHPFELQGYQLNGPLTQEQVDVFFCSSINLHVLTKVA
jgi:hypothetical protein